MTQEGEFTLNGGIFGPFFAAEGDVFVQVV